jgi:heptaprenyl diphosphate synthase
VRLWLIPHASVSYLIPIFATAALFFGLINGLITAKLLYNKTQLLESDKTEHGST